MSITSLLSKAGALVLTGAAILGVAYGIAKYVNDFENAKAEIQNLRGQIAQLQDILARTQSASGDDRLDRIERDISELRDRISQQTKDAEALSITDRLRTGQFSGTVTDGQRVWPFRASNITFTGGNEFEADIDWQTLDAVHHIKGRYSETSLFFKEIAFVKKGNNVLGCEYTLETTQPSGLSGTYRNCDEGASGGTIEVRWF
ncbi:MAG: hypothetical protein WBA88_25945 [Pseudaminobacter sp.]